MHRQYRSAAHKPQHRQCVSLKLDDLSLTFSSAGLDASRASTGVVWTTERAYEHGFLEEPELWANLGQGAPEVDDDIEGSFKRPSTIDVSVTGREYVCRIDYPVSGLTCTGPDCRNQAIERSCRESVQ